MWRKLSRVRRTLRLIRINVRINCLTQWGRRIRRWRIMIRLQLLKTSMPLMSPPPPLISPSSSPSSAFIGGKIPSTSSKPFSFCFLSFISQNSLITLIQLLMNLHFGPRPSQSVCLSSQTVLFVLSQYSSSHISSLSMYRRFTSLIFIYFSSFSLLINLHNIFYYFPMFPPHPLLSSFLFILSPSQFFQHHKNIHTSRPELPDTNIILSLMSYSWHFRLLLPAWSVLIRLLLNHRDRRRILDAAYHSFIIYSYQLYLKAGLCRKTSIQLFYEHFETPGWVSRPT